MTNLAEMTIGQWQARQTRKAARMLAHFVATTQEDRLRWLPLSDEGSKARSVMDMAGECVDSNQRILAYLTGAEAVQRPTNFDAFATVAELSAALIASADAVADEISKATGADVERIVQTHRGAIPLGVVIQLPLRNMTYHIGQINMVQLLYGDAQFHISEDFLTL